MSVLLRTIFPIAKPIIAMLHVFEGERQRQVDQALGDLERLQSHVDGVLVENYDWGFWDSNLAISEVTEVLLVVAEAVARKATIPVGVNVLPNDYEKAFLVAHEVGAHFIQLDHITGAYLAENLDGEYVRCRPVDPDHLLKLRSKYPGIVIFGGIHPKYYLPADPTMTIAGSARMASRLADAVVVTGSRTGEQASLADLSEAKDAVDPYVVFVGSGLTPQNVLEQFAIADGAIVGSALKKCGVVPWEPIDEGMRDELMMEVKRLRERFPGKERT